MVIVLKNNAQQQQVDELSDGSQQLTPQAFAETMKKIRALAEFMGKPVQR
jgi:3-deoxy-D-arabino-heptulosonate 7-phosphate (DAHP) synthase